MVEISEKEIHKVSEDMDRLGLTYTWLKNELLDHICCNVENYMRDGLTFNEAYLKVKREIGSRRIMQVQDATVYLINQKYRRMKRLMLVLGISTSVIILLGTVFKMLHWPGSGILLTLGIVSLSLVFIPLFVMVRIRDTRERKKIINRSLLITGLMTGILFSLGSLLKIMHWPGANVTLGTSLIVGLLFLILFLVDLVKNKENWIENFTYVMLISLFFAFVNLVYVTTNNSKRPLIDGLVISESTIGTNSDYLSEQSEHLVQKVHGNVGNQAYGQMLTLKNEADQICYFIQSLKLDIVKGEHEQNQEAINDKQQIDFWKVRGKASGNEVYHIMFGENRSGKAEELRRMLEAYKANALALCQDGTTRRYINAGLSLDLDKERDEGNFPKEKNYVNWEESRFLYFPLILAANNLSHIEEMVRMIELEVIRSLSPSL
ncbi:MAG: hypothetical protein ABFS28_15300 [Bacteroidota bacterium]